MGCLLCQNFPTQEMGSITQLYDLQNTLNFNYLNESSFLGYPFYNELVRKISIILSANKKAWLKYEDQMIFIKQQVVQYRQFAQYALNQLKDVLFKKKSGKQIADENNLEFAQEFNLLLRHCITFEIQELKVLTALKGNVQMKIIIRERDKIKEFVSIKKQVKKIVIFDWVETYELQDSFSREKLRKSGKVKNKEDYLNNCQIQLDVIGQEQFIQGKITFNLIELADQRIHERLIKLTNENNQQANAKVLMRIQVVYNLERFLEWWLEELSLREIQIDRINEQIQDTKQELKDIDYDIGESIKEDDDGEVIDERYASLFSYKSLSQSYQSAYELPWFIR